ncbi:MAG: DUF188 domain-containing protein [Spirochaetales bacterium]|nr:DUF188 domain-containing protein [Spirochaetales bacterium]
MTVFIDADSCPGKARSIVYRACAKHSIPCVQAANRHIPHPPQVTMVITSNKEGAADEHIIAAAQEGDLVITRDIPLASQLLENNVTVLNDRGTIFSRDTIKERLSLRNTIAEFRAHGMLEPSQKNYGPKELKAFADCFDATVHKLLKSQPS